MRTPPDSGRSLSAALLTLLLVAGACAPDDPAGPAAVREPVVAAAPTGACGTGAALVPARLMECVTLEAVRAHQAALQSIADANGGTRATGSPGYRASVDYVVGRLEAAGYDVTFHPVPYNYVPAGSALNQVAPVPTSYPTEHFTGTASGSVTAPVTAVDIQLGLGNASTSGCEPADFAGFTPGHIALVQRGTCLFADKALNAEAAGASGVIIFNQGNTEDRKGVINGTLGEAAVTIPVVAAAYDDGVELSAPGVVASVYVPPARIGTDYSVLAETRTGDPDNVVLVGGHLDSVERGPGIQDNGAGAAAILETAIQMARARVANKVRFAWWGGMELGLVGSSRYVADLSPAELNRIALYLNFDIIASPNYGLFVYDADESDVPAPVPVPDGSDAIEDVFEAFYDARGLPYRGTEFSGRSDYRAFIDVGIPAGGLFTGAEVIKTPEDAALWGGTAGDQFDPCYHLACDTFDNVSLMALDINADAVAFATLTFGRSTEAVNGVRGRGTPPGRPGSVPPGPPDGVPPGPPSR